jgi:hypothetical protein
MTKHSARLGRLEAAVEARMVEEWEEVFELLKHHLDEPTFLRVAEILLSEGYSNPFRLQDRHDV